MSGSAEPSRQGREDVLADQAVVVVVGAVSLLDRYSCLGTAARQREGGWGWRQQVRGPWEQKTSEGRRALGEVTRGISWRKL